MIALDNRRANGPRLPISTPGSWRVASPFRASGSTLKYTPYDPPEIIPRLRTRSSSHRGLSNPRQVSLDTHVTSLPMTAGDLALAAGLQELEIISNVILNLVDYSQKDFSHLCYSNHFLWSMRLEARNYRWEVFYDLISAP